MKEKKPAPIEGFEFQSRSHEDLPHADCCFSPPSRPACRPYHEPAQLEQKLVAVAGQRFIHDRCASGKPCELNHRHGTLLETNPRASAAAPGHGLVEAHVVVIIALDEQHGRTPVLREGDLARRTTRRRALSASPRS